ncbi:hypothetical protein B7494_g2105 [Chlorociboria aeruginascens]|nr:hypothetical protein B7494_g2105 [Chlorociboria aeruginascens]
MDQTRPISTKLPAGLAGVMNQPEESRDSAYFSTAPSSKHNSTSSHHGMNVLSPSSAGYQSSYADNTPSPIAANSQTLNSPVSGGMSVASMVSPSSAITDQSMLRRLDRQSYELSIAGDPSSRRESVDSRLGGGFENLKLAGSPYASNNQSTTSIQSSLAHQRNPGSVTDRNSYPRFSNGYDPNAQRLPETISPKLSRTAPLITGPAVGNIARAPEPTKGQAWAFPEEEVQRLPSAARPSAENDNRQGMSFLDSRRSSLADSIASSQYTTESRLPAGQRRLEDGMPMDYLSRASSELQTHHHSLQNRQLGDIQGNEGSSPGSSQPYSRTPELRVSHKLAERKRRTEMKELFDNLRDLLPQQRGPKASKWEILSRSIEQHHAQAKEIRTISHDLQVTRSELESSRQETHTLRQENHHLRAELSHVAGHPGHHAGHPNGYMHAAQPPTAMDAYSNDPYARQNRPEAFPNPVRQEQLPPLRATISGPAPSESMSGVQRRVHDDQNGVSALRAASASFVSTPRAITTSSTFVLRSKAVQTGISPSVFKRFTSGDANSEELSSLEDSADDEGNSVQSAIDSASEFASSHDAGEAVDRPPHQHGEDAAVGGFAASQQNLGPPNLAPGPSIYIGNLLFDITDADLQREFSQFGTIKSATVASDARGLSKGFGYVRFDNVESATAAIKAKNQTILEGRRLIVNYQSLNYKQGLKNPPSRTLFIGNLAFEMSDVDLNKLFREIKNVLDVRVAVDRRTGQPRGFAHADFVDAESAAKAMETLQGKEIYGRALRLDYSGSRADRYNDGIRQGGYGGGQASGGRQGGGFGGDRGSNYGGDRGGGYGGRQNGGHAGGSNY